MQTLKCSVDICLLKFLQEQGGLDPEGNKELDDNQAITGSVKNFLKLYKIFVEVYIATNKQFSIFITKKKENKL